MIQISAGPRGSQKVSAQSNRKGGDKKTGQILTNELHKTSTKVATWHKLKNTKKIIENEKTNKKDEASVLGATTLVTW